MRPFCVFLLTLKRHSAEAFPFKKLVDIVIRHQEPCVILKRPYESNRVVKGRVGPKYHKRMRGYEHTLAERLKGESKKAKKKKKKTFSREKGKRSALFPPKKHRVKRWPLYK